MTFLPILAQAAGASSLDTFLTKVLDGLALGAIYAIVALGFVLVFKATSVLNFAHGSFLMLAAYLATTFLVVMDMPFIVGLTIIAVMLALLGVILHYSIMQWMVGKPFFAVVLVTVGMEIVIRALLLVLYGPLERGKIQKLTTGTIEIGGAVVPTVNIIIFIAAIAVVVAFLAFFRLTRMGLHMRAVAENLEAATAMGINPNTVYATAWGIGLLLAGVGGVLYAHFTASIDLNLVQGFVIEEGGHTGHTAIIARSLGVPAVVGLARASRTISTGDELAVDGTRGQVYVGPDADTCRRFEVRIHRRKEAEQRLLTMREAPAETIDASARTRAGIAAKLRPVFIECLSVCFICSPPQATTASGRPRRAFSIIRRPKRHGLRSHGVNLAS